MKRLESSCDICFCLELTCLIHYDLSQKLSPNNTDCHRRFQTAWCLINALAGSLTDRRWPPNLLFSKTGGKVNERLSLPGPVRAVSMTGVLLVSEVVNHVQVLTLVIVRHRYLKVELNSFQINECKPGGHSDQNFD